MTGHHRDFRSDAISISKVFAVAFVLLPLSAQAQLGSEAPKVELDSNYVIDLSSRPTMRFYLSTKYNSMTILSQEPGPDLRYRPNGRFNIGIGASYRKLTLNIGVPIPFVNADSDKKGKTSYFDAQANLYGSQQASNLFLQVYKGYHIPSLTKPFLGWEQETDVPYRGDLVQYNLGISTLRMLQPERFSYRATFNQDAVQLRSQGSWLVGGYLTSFFVRADSALVPDRLEQRFGFATGATRASFVDLGIMAGRAMTAVHRRKWFFTVSAAGGVGPAFQHFAVPESGNSIGRPALGWHFQGRAGAGYHTRWWFYGVIYNQEFIGQFGQRANGFRWDVGNLRVMVCKHLQQRAPRSVDRGLRWLEKNTPVPLPDRP